MMITTENIIDKLVELFTTLQVIEIGQTVATNSKAKLFAEFPLEVHPEEDLEVLKSSLDVIAGQHRVNAITIAEKTNTPNQYLDIVNLIDYSQLDNLISGDDDVYTYRIWHWLQFGRNSQRLAYRYRDAMKSLVKNTNKLNFPFDKLDYIQSVGRLKTEFTELMYSKSGAVNITGMTLEVRLID